MRPYEDSQYRAYLLRTFSGGRTVIWDSLSGQLITEVESKDEAHALIDYWMNAS